MEEVLTEGRLFATFEKHEEFLHAQQLFLSVDLAMEPNSEQDKHEAELLGKLTSVLDEYQEQAYLLDPFLEQLVVPVAERLKDHARASVHDRDKSGRGAMTRVGRVGLLLYGYIKCRGFKTIIRFFPHEIADLSIALEYLLMPNGPSQEPSHWCLRYVVLLWLSLICMIPFDLSQFDEPQNIGKTAFQIESLGKGFLGKAGLERDGAAMLLSRFYTRKDTRSRFQAFLEWSKDLLQGAVDVFTSIGLLQVLCEVVKSGPSEQIHIQLARILSFGQAVDGTPTLISNTVVRKFRIKLVSRVALRIIPPRTRVTRHKGRSLVEQGSFTAPDVMPEDEDIDVPEEVENALDEHFRAMQDKDTIVRWSAAKGVARISERLPSDFAEQVMDTIMGLFSIHSIVASSLYTMPAIAESTWHGACLACAEMARRGLVGRTKLLELIDWLSKALYFDIRKGAHSIGSNVRDAAAYVLWAIARSQDATALTPHAENLARRLVTVALYDREIHIRRAASAAFQEHVGRMGLFPHGIDILRKTDFYAVSVRRNAFTVAASQVAEHSEYRKFLFDHLLGVTLRHWDPPMRQLGAQSLRLICQCELSVLGPKAVELVARLFDSVDNTDIHGGLLALTELAASYLDHSEFDVARHEIFCLLARIPQKVLLSPRNELVTAAACELVAKTISLTEIQLNQRSSVPYWRKIIDYGLRHSSTVVQESAAVAMAAISTLTDCSTVIREFKSGSPRLQQSLGRFLGTLDYTAYRHSLPEAIQCLLDSVSQEPTKKMENVEARRNCYLAMSQILLTVSPQIPEHLPPDIVRKLYKALQDGLEDYTIDERGDVGSWIRTACIKGLTSFSEIFFAHAGVIPNFEEYLPAFQFHNAVGGILKQGVERLDGVRQEAGTSIIHLLLFPQPAVPGGELWQIRGSELMKELFLSEIETVGWHEGAWLFPKAVRLLEVSEYRKMVLTGLVLSVGSRTNSTQRPAASSMASYAQSLPASASGAAYNLISLVEDLIDHAKSHITSNTVVVPVLQTFNVLLEADVFERLSRSPEGDQSLQTLLLIASRNIPRLKNVQRILESMKILVNLLPIPHLFYKCVPHLADFLSHQFPKVRSDTAEYLYLVLQSKDVRGETDDVEDILLETEWSSTDTNISNEAASRLVDLLGHI